MAKSAKKSSRKETIRRLSQVGWDQVRLKSILKAVKGKKVLVIGDVGVDRYTIGSVERISPEAPVPIVAVEEEKIKLGLAANVADNVKALGGLPLLTGIIGDDRTAEDFKFLLKAAGIQSSYLIVDRGRRTVLKERIVSERQQLLRVDYESVGKVSAAVEERLFAKIKLLIPESDVLILEDYAKGLLSRELAASIFEAARKNGKFVAVDPNVKTDIGLYFGASVLTPNTKEAERLSGVVIYDENSLILAGRRLLEMTSARHVVITRGKEGMAIFSADEAEVHMIPTYAREVYDVSGAGDTVISVLALALSAEASMEEAAILGNLAAGVEVGKRGTATVLPEEILMAMEFFRTTQH
jgi:D-glycero-beta-D-manno-heptose-7-phosphate kinase